MAPAEFNPSICDILETVMPIRRSLSRREALALLTAAGALAAGPDEALHFTALDHIETSAPDSAKTAAFYARLFGAPVWKNKNTARRYVMLGSRYIAVEQGRQPFGVDHFSVGIEGFVVADIHAWLKQRGIAYRDYPSGKDLNVDDPDGIHIQLSADNTWADMKDRLVSPEASPESGLEVAGPIFQPTGLDHVLLNVSDLPVSVAFYEKVFGPAARGEHNRTWFQAGKSRIGLLQAPAGTKPGVNYYCVSAAAFNFTAVLKKLEEAGARVERPEAAGVPEFRDPDGLLVRVVPAK
jgi:catechol 2,3-dioxygenase-like lactoylglutathione lyase family enzyme